MDNVSFPRPLAEFMRNQVGGVGPYLNRTLWIEYYRQRQRVPLPAVLIQPVTLGELRGDEGFRAFQLQLARSAARIVTTVRNGDGVDRCYSSGVLAEYQGFGYLLTCAHAFPSDYLGLVVTASNRGGIDEVNELSTHSIFGQPMVDEVNDVAYLPVLRPDLLDPGDFSFQPVFRFQAEANSRFVSGFPGAWSQTFGHEVKDQVETINERATWCVMLEDDDSSPRGPKLASFPEQIGLRVRQESYHEPVSQDWKITPESFRGMSGGPVWGGLGDQCGIIGIVTHESDQRFHPREFWFAGIDKVLDLIDRREAAVRPPLQED